MNSYSNQKIILSVAPGSDKTTTYDFEIIELDSLKQLMHTMNQKAVSVGLFQNGHRKGNYIGAGANVYFIDIDVKLEAGKKPYYQVVEEKLKNKDISFVSVPSRSADKYIYRRHIAIVLDSFLPTGKKEFESAAIYILNTIGIEKSKIDEHVRFSRVAFLAPASINKGFTDIDEISNYYEGQPFNLSEYFIRQNTYKNTDDQNVIDSDGLITFADGSRVRIFEAKKLIVPGKSRSCYCPNKIHNDKHPSATYYHNSSGQIQIFCGKCGNVKINKNFIPTVPLVNHDNYKYSIILNDVASDKIDKLTSLLGQCTAKSKATLTWHYKVSSITDIHRLILVKIYLVQKGFFVSPLRSMQKPIHLLNTDTLMSITENTIIPKPFIPKDQETSPSYFRHKQMAKFVFEHYLFAEAAIWTTYQNLISPNRLFSDTCNVGLAYFDFILQKIKEEQGFKFQKLKTFPMRLKGRKKTDVEKKRVENMKKGKEASMGKREKQVKRLLEDPLYRKKNGQPNISAIARKLEISRQTVHTHYNLLQRNFPLKTP